jgi:alpha-1,2-mannosyltransferase
MISDKTLARVFGSARLAGLVGDLVRLAIGAGVVTAIGVWIVYYALVARSMVVQLHMNDFGKFYYSARLFLDGQDMYRPTAATLIPVATGRWRQFWNMNPPHFHAPLLLLARLPPTAALAVWAALSVVSLVACLRIIRLELDLTVTVPRALWGGLALLVFAGTGATVVTGQMTWLLLAPVTLAWKAARHNRWVRCGAWCGLGMSIKPFLLIFLPYFLLRRHVRAALAAVVAMAGVLATGLAVFGLAPYLSWVRSLGAVDWAWAGMNGSLLGFLSRAMVDNPQFAPWLVALRLALPIWLACVAIVGALTIGAAVVDHSPEAVDRSFATLLVGALVISPLGWVYYLWLAIGPIAAVAVAWVRRRAKMGQAARWRFGVLAAGTCACLAVPVAALLQFQPSVVATLTLGSAYFWGTALLWAWLLLDTWFARRARRAPAFEVA